MPVTPAKRRVQRRPREGHEDNNEGQQPIFVHENGSAVKFYLMSQDDPLKITNELVPFSPARTARMRKQIEDYGGIIVDDVREADTLIVNDAALDRYCKYYQFEPKLWVEPPEFIRNCVLHERYEHILPQRRAMGGRPGGDHSRKPFTPEEDKFLAHYLAIRILNNESGGRCGNSVYKELEDQGWEFNSGPYVMVRNHPWQSWRERYVKRKHIFDNKIAAIVAQNGPIPAKTLYPLDRTLGPSFRLTLVENHSVHEDEDTGTEDEDDEAAYQPISGRHMKRLREHHSGREKEVPEPSSTRSGKKRKRGNDDEDGYGSDDARHARRTQPARVDARRKMAASVRVREVSSLKSNRPFADYDDKEDEEEEEEEEEGAEEEEGPNDGDVQDGVVLDINHRPSVSREASIEREQSVAQAGPSRTQHSPTASVPTQQFPFTVTSLSPTTKSFIGVEVKPYRSRPTSRGEPDNSQMTLINPTPVQQRRNAQPSLKPAPSKENQVPQHGQSTRQLRSHTRQASQSIPPIAFLPEPEDVQTEQEGETQLLDELLDDDTPLLEGQDEDEGDGTAGAPHSSVEEIEDILIPGELQENEDADVSDSDRKGMQSLLEPPEQEDEGEVISDSQSLELLEYES